MFRNPRENATRNPYEKLRPYTGRPPSPSSITHVHATETPIVEMGVETTTAPEPPKLGLPNQSKRTPSKNGKANIKGNNSILNFFKKAEVDLDSSGLFVEDKTGALNAFCSIDTVDPADEGISNHLSTTNGPLDKSRFNESQSSVKRRKISHSRSPSPGESTVQKAAKNFDEQGCLTPLSDFDSKQSPGICTDRLENKRDVRPKGKLGPFVDESDSEDGADTIRRPFGFKTAPDLEGNGQVLKEIEEVAEVAKPGKGEHNPHDVFTEPPSLKREPTSFVEQDGFADFEGMEDFEDEYEGGEEYVERRYMREQRRLEAEAGVRDGADEDDPYDIQDEAMNTEPTELDAEVEGQTEDQTGESGPTCPLCNASLKDVSDQDASVHVNNCLDGKPTPLPKSTQTPAKPSESNGTSKRFVRPPKPGQQNPFTLGQSSGTSSAFSKLMSGHSEETAWSAAAASERDSRGKSSYQRTCPFYKILPGFYTCVDAFRYGAVTGCNAYFLSHFHSDHYVGLTSTWSHGKIYCSRITGNLVRQQLRVDPKWVVDLEWEEKVEVPHTQGVYVTMIPANHCPGSSLFLFEKLIEPPKNAPPTAKQRTQRVLHCGDFRACPAHIAHPQLAPEVVDKVTGKLKHQKIDVCYLDTTYLNPKYAFPSQEDVITACADMCTSLSKEKIDEKDSYETMKRERAGNAMSKFVHKDSKDENTDSTSPTDLPAPKCRGPLLVVVGTYSIGKERICLGIARALDSLIYAPHSKQRICAALNDPELTKRLTSDPLAASVHMTPLFEIRAETLSEYLESYKGHFCRAVGFRPSGWNYRPPGGRSMEAPTVSQVLYSPGWKSTFTMRDLVPQRGSTRTAGVYGVPYSEHSSFRELSMFVCGLHIEKVIPTVNVGSAKGREKMRAWCERWAAEKRKNGLFRVWKGDGERVDREKGDEGRAGEFYPGGGTWELRTTL